MNKNIATAVLFLIGCLLGLLTMEVTLRIFERQFAPMISLQHQPCIYQEDQSTGYRYIPNSTGRIYRKFEMDNVVRINSQGFHDVEHNSKNSGNQRQIIVIGDSMTAAIHVPVADTWTRVLSQELTSRDNVPNEVWNLGLDGTGTDAHVQLLREHLRNDRPDTVILAFYKNDIEDLQQRKRFRECYEGNVLVFNNQDQQYILRRYVDEKSPRQKRKWLFRNVYSFRLATWVADELFNYGHLLRSNWVFPSIIGLDISQGYNSQRGIIKSLVELERLSKEFSFRLFILPIPTKLSATGSLDMMRESIPPDVLDRFEVIDVSPKLDQLLEVQEMAYSNLYWKYDGHFNSEGNRLFASAVAETLMEAH